MNDKLVSKHLIDGYLSYPGLGKGSSNILLSHMHMHNFLEFINIANGGQYEEISHFRPYLQYLEVHE